MKRKLLKCNAKFFNEIDSNDSHTITVSITANEFKRKYKRKSLNSIYELLSEEIDTHCHHSYDCCGNWYSSVSNLRRIKNKLVFEISSYRNV